jgi:hypothetical protein
MTETSELLAHGKVNEWGALDSQVDRAQTLYFFMEGGTLDAVFETYKKQMKGIQSDSSLSPPDKVMRYSVCNSRFNACIARSEKYKRRDKCGEAASLVDQLIAFLFGWLGYQNDRETIEQKLKNFHETQKIPRLAPPPRKKN